MLRDQKIELNEIKTQQNDTRRVEAKERGDLLKQDNILTKLLGERNFLFWLEGLKKLGELVPRGTSNYKIAMLVRGSIDNAEDKKNTQGMTLMEDIIAYVNQRYMNSPNLLNATLWDIKERRLPTYTYLLMSNCHNLQCWNLNAYYREQEGNSTIRNRLRI
jgi:hypothetical protein